MLAALVAGFFAFWNLGVESFQPEDEALHVSVVQQMIFNDHLWVPHSENGLYLNKPPLKMWMTVPLVNYFGSTPYVYRVWDALFGFITMLLVFYLGHYFFQSFIVGLVSELFLCSAWIFLFDHCVRSATQDSSVVLVTTLAMLWGHRLLQRPDFDWRLGGYLFLVTAAGIFMKSIGATQGLLMILLVSLLQRQPLKKSVSIGLILGAACIPLAGYLFWIWFEYGRIMERTLNRELVERVFHGMQGRYKYFFYFYLIFYRDLAINGGSLIGATGIVWWRFKSMTIEMRRTVVFLAVFAITPFIVFSFVNTRLEWYIIPALPAQALFCGYALVEITKTAYQDLLQLRWRFTKDVIVRRTLYGAAIGLLLYGLVTNLSDSTRRVLWPEALSPLSEMEAALAPSRSIHGLVVAQDVTKLLPGVFERAHFKSLAHGNIKVADSRDEFQRRFVVLDTKTLAVGEPEDVMDLFKQGLVKSFKSIPPVIQVPEQHQREHWLTFISASSSNLPGFESVVTEYQLRPGIDSFVVPTNVYSRTLGVNVIINVRNESEPMATGSITLKRTVNSKGLEIPCKSIEPKKLLCRIDPEIMSQAKATIGFITLPTANRSNPVPYTVQIAIHT